MLPKSIYVFCFYLCIEAAVSTLPEYTTRRFVRVPFRFGSGVQPFKQTLHDSDIVSDALEFGVSFWVTFRSAGPAEYFSMRADSQHILRVTFDAANEPAAELKNNPNGRNYLDLAHPSELPGLNWYFVHVRLSKNANLRLHLNLHTGSTAHDLNYFPEFDSLSLEFCAESAEGVEKCDA